jgi:hypothetical protein
MEAWRDELYHYAKGETAKNHKYIRKEGNRYIYADDNKGSTKNKSGIGNWLSGAANSVGNWVSGAANSVASTIQNATDSKVIAAKQRLDNAKRQLEILKTNNSDLVSDYTTNKNTVQTKVKNSLRKYNITNGSKLDISIDGIVNNAVFAYKQALKNPDIVSQIAIFWAIRDTLQEQYPEIANVFEGEDMMKTLYYLAENNAKYNQYQSDLRYYTELVASYEKEYDKLKHSDVYSQELFHGCLGGTAVIHRF